MIKILTQFCQKILFDFSFILQRDDKFTQLILFIHQRFEFHTHDKFNYSMEKYDLLMSLKLF